MSKRFTWIVMGMMLFIGGFSMPGWAADEPVSAAAPTVALEITDILQAPLAAPATPAATEDPGAVWMDQLLADPSLNNCNNFCCTSNAQCVTRCGDAAACVTSSPGCKRCILL